MSAALALYCTDAVRRLDQLAIAAGTPALELMERAGLAAFARLREAWPQVRRILVCCGPGNNGGDGYVLARLAAEAGIDVCVLSLSDALPKTEEARTVLLRWQQRGGNEVYLPEKSLPEADVVVDALFGIGIDRPVQGAAAALIEAINRHPAPVLAMDVPSGLDADLGCAPGVVVDADLTISFVAAKRGLYTGAGRARSGRVLVDALGVEPSAAAPEADARLVAHDLVRHLLPPRAEDAHKGDFGHVLAVGGDHGMGGAIRLCVEAAGRCGAGLVSAITRPEHVVSVISGRPECMVQGWDEQLPLPEAVLQRATVIALGPGLGRAGWGNELFKRALLLPQPLVLDADALFFLAADSLAVPNAILTPHPGEAGRLLGQSTAEVQADRYAAARALARRFHCVVVLKGNGTLIADDEGRIEVVAAGNPGLASGGSGDVLTGVIAALRAQGLGPFDAARLGALLHAQAADIAAAEGQRGMLASDLFAPLRRLVNR